MFRAIGLVKKNPWKRHGQPDGHLRACERACACAVASQAAKHSHLPMASMRITPSVYSVVLFLQAVGAYLHICSRRSETFEPAHGGPGLRGFFLKGKNVSGCLQLPCYKRGIPEVGLWLTHTSRHLDYWASRHQRPQEGPQARPWARSGPTRNGGGMPGWEGGSTG